MTPLPGALGGQGLVAWRLDRARHAASWDSGEGAFQVGGRWNPAGVRAVYAAFDPAAAVLEVAVHKGFGVLDSQPHQLTRFEITAPDKLRVYQPEDVPDPDWLSPNDQTPAQRVWGAEQLQAHKVIILPSAVSRNSWNLVFLAPLAEGWIGAVQQEPFILDPRLHPKE